MVRPQDPLSSSASDSVLLHFDSMSPIGRLMRLAVHARVRLLHHEHVPFLAMTDQPGVEWAEGGGGDRCPSIRPSIAPIRYIISKWRFSMSRGRNEEPSQMYVFIFPKSSYNSSLVFLRRYGSSARSQFELYVVSSPRIGLTPVLRWHFIAAD